MAAQCREVLGSHAIICSGRRADRYRPNDNRGSSSIRFVGYWLRSGSTLPRFLSERSKRGITYLLGIRSAYPLSLWIHAEVIRDAQVDVECLLPEVFRSLQPRLFVRIRDE